MAAVTYQVPYYLIQTAESAEVHFIIVRLSRDFNSKSFRRLDKFEGEIWREYAAVAHKRVASAKGFHRIRARSRELPAKVAQLHNKLSYLTSHL